MELTGLTTDTSTFPGATDATGTQDLDKDAFMNLLVQQLKNQDPMDPQSNDEFIAQLASFSSLEQMQNMNDNLLSVALLQDNNALMSQLTTGSSLIGKEVAWDDPETGAPQSGTVKSLKVQNGSSFLDVGGTLVPLQAISEVSEGSEPAA
jgi:flagellar basal-body rod modification protein FlgD